MEYLRDRLKRMIAGKILRAEHTFLLLDYDGTLTPILPKPEMAHLRESTRKILEKLSEYPDVSVGIITGRKIDEIQSLVKLKNLIYAGNHGLELRGPNFNYTHAKTKEYRRIFRNVAMALRPLPKFFPGSFLEDKEVTLTYHYRQMDPEQVPALIRTLVKSLRPWLMEKKIKLMEVKKAIEIRPNFNWHKGSAVRWILLHEDPDSLPVFIGDDKTDESAFKALNEIGFTIKVGFEKGSYAQYFVKDHDEVERFLSFISVLKNSQRHQ